MACLLREERLRLVRTPSPRRSNMHKRIITTVALLGMASAFPALAQSDYRAPWRGDFWGYVGASGGQSEFRTDCHNTTTRFFDCDKRDTGFKVYAGGKMNDWLGLEVGYTDFGKVAASGG